MAVEMMQAKGFNNNFSSYVADLVRRDKEMKEEKDLRRRELEARFRTGNYAGSDQPHQQHAHAEEGKLPYKTKKDSGDGDGPQMPGEVQN